MEKPLKSRKLFAVLALSASIFTGCGGGGGGSGGGGGGNVTAPAISYPSNSITFATEYSKVITPSNTGGAVAGGYVVFPSSSRVLAIPY